jgi:hypothetical protein
MQMNGERLMKIIRIAVTLLLGILLVSGFACVGEPAAPTPTPTPTPTLNRPILVSPVAGAEDVVPKPVLEWSMVIGATNYELVLVRNCDWNDIVVDKTGAAALGSETAYHVPTPLAYGSSYCWKVRALDELADSPWSDTRSFTIMSITASNIKPQINYIPSGWYLYADEPYGMYENEYGKHGWIEYRSPLNQQGLFGYFSAAYGDIPPLLEGKENDKDALIYWARYEAQVSVKESGTMVVCDQLAGYVKGHAIAYGGARLVVYDDSIHQGLHLYSTLYSL